MSRRILALLHAVLVALLTACTSAPAAPVAAERPDGAQLITGDGVSLWHRIAGVRGAPVVLYLHGGPGYNSYDFEATAGRLLERHVRVVYVDQRGCGRSSLSSDSTASLGVEPTVADLDVLLGHLNLGRVVLIGHSFGGFLALAFADRHPHHVAGLVLVDTTGDLPAAFAHQVDVLAAQTREEAGERTDEIEAIVRASDAPVQRLLKAYGLFGPQAVQRRVLYGSDEAQHRHAALDTRSGLRDRGSPRVFDAYLGDGSLTSEHRHLMRRLSVPGMLVAGGRSEAIGGRQLEAAAAKWDVPLVRLERSGHFVYVDEPEAFADLVLRVVSATE